VLGICSKRVLIEDIAQDRSDASRTQSVDLPLRPSHGRDDMSFGQHER